MDNTPRDHGGNLDAAMHRFGGDRAQWIDLSTGINPVPYPMPPLSRHAVVELPTTSDMTALREAAATCYGTRAHVTPLAGAQAAIQAVPHLSAPGRARVLSPTYNEHAAALRARGWTVDEVRDLGALAGADCAVVVTPNNPDGARHDPARLAALAAHVGLLVVDESFADPEPALSLAPRLHAGPENILVLRSFGKFYGLAGLRLGFTLSSGEIARTLAAMAGPWPISGPAIEVALRALTDSAWRAETTARLARDAARLDALGLRAGWSLVGGTPLFRTYVTPDAAAAQERLARHRIWSRIFPYSRHWLRLGLAGSEAEWTRLESAL
ncbi:threonine-phosphate decarboxylase [Roseovarius sp. A-2]|uniref:threonine-phosphate decarboxylase CobD n=1 Tax=Roseovarius sp. A-2 TaxID=1570360 RepID=UPI0009B52F20|nr:threonine-phosphate decarboxylase CobD [Roseovarius sp. A-2]GAW34615.1 threonine-phosphate decarboxylase [Roseovarius sp. A-2]